MRRVCLLNRRLTRASSAILKSRRQLNSSDEPPKPPAGFGVIHEDEEKDISRLVKTYSAEALASAVRDREDMLQMCAQCVEEKDTVRLRQLLSPYRREVVQARRRERRTLDLRGGLTRKHLLLLRSHLQSLPEHVDIANELRAAVVVPLCNVDGVASVLFERRAAHMRRFSSQVCFPGGMVDDAVDDTVLETSLRELYEEVGIDADHVEVLGVLRCDWAELDAITGVAVTPVMAFLGVLEEDDLNPNPDEVMELFTVPLRALLDQNKWSVKPHSTPVFNGGPHIIWGLTAQILCDFLKEFFWNHGRDIVDHDYG